MKNALPYIALGATICMLLFGNNIIGSSNERAMQVNSSLAVIHTQLINQKELAEKQYAKIQGIELVQKKHSEKLYMLGVDTRQRNRLLSARGSQASDEPDFTISKWDRSKRSGGQD
tara:strand:+ start:87 stop:434 length:348 start_codon:yes stop_codon:yes gene_type:complete